MLIVKITTIKLVYCTTYQVSIGTEEKVILPNNWIILFHHWYLFYISSTLRLISFDMKTCVIFSGPGRWNPKDDEFYISISKVIFKGKPFIISLLYMFSVKQFTQIKFKFKDDCNRSNTLSLYNYFEKMLYKFTVNQLGGEKFCH